MQDSTLGLMLEKFAARGKGGTTGLAVAHGRAALRLKFMLRFATSPAAMRPALLLFLFVSVLAIPLHPLQPSGNHEEIFFASVYLEDDNKQGLGTGFFFAFEDRPDQVLLVTNKHVLENSPWNWLGNS